MRAVASLCLCLWIASIGTAQEGPGVVSEERFLTGFPQSRYFLLTREEAETPAKGHGLLVVLPGGAGKGRDIAGRAGEYDVLTVGVRCDETVKGHSAARAR